MPSETKTVQFKRMEPEEAQELEQDLQYLLAKEWTGELVTLGFSEKKLVAANALMKEFCRGVVDTVRNQLKRHLIPKAYILPQVVLKDAPETNPWAYNTLLHIIIVDKGILEELLMFYPDKEVSFSAGGNLVFLGLPLDFVYQGGNHEGKHSVDNLAGKLTNHKTMISGVEYDSQSHELRSLGMQVLLSGKRNPESTAHKTMKNYLRQVIKFKGKKE